MTSILDPAVPGGAFDEFLREVAPASKDQRAWTPEDGRLPSLFVSHGAPPTFDDAEWIGELHAWAVSLPKPKGILIISAHWENAPLSLSGSRAGTPLVYDFGGFHPRYFQMRYPTPDASELARQVRAMLPDTTEVHEHATRGLDHGAWVPLKIMYPYGDVPVLQMSLPTDRPDRLIALGASLRELRDQGILIIGSGFMTHGLPYLTREMWLGKLIPAWSRDFDAWAADALSRGDVAQLSDYRHRAPGMPYAHPTVEHYTPLFITLGAADDPESAATTTIQGYMAGLSRRSFQIN